MNTLSLPIRAEGRPDKELHTEFVRVITFEDLPRAHQRTRPEGTLDKIRSIHHYIALLIAAGLPAHEVAQRSGRTLARVNQLVVTPIFVQLIEEKRKALEGDAKVHILDNLMRWDRLQTAALDEIQERIEEEPEKFTVSQLLSIAGEGGDRAGPTKKSVQVNANFDFADRLAAARKKMFGEDARLVEPSGASTAPLMESPALGSPSLERDREDRPLAGKCQ